MSEQKKTKKVLSKKGKVILDIILIASLIVAGISGYKLVTGLVGYHQAAQEYDTVKTEAKLPTSTNASAVGEENPTVDWNYLKGVNENVAAWITLPDSSIDYPVVYADDNDYYLNHLLDGSYNYSGCIFIDYRNAREFVDKNTVMYGHHMYSQDTMFNALTNYANQSYYDSHKTYTLETPHALYEVQVVAGIQTTGTGDYIQLSFSTDAEFLAYVDSFVKNSTFQSNVTVSAGDQIVTLSTCSEAQKDGRYALMGKLVKVKDYQ